MLKDAYPEAPIAQKSPTDRFSPSRLRELETSYEDIEFDITFCVAEQSAKSIHLLP
jgi:hypothetical protein